MGRKRVPGLIERAGIWHIDKRILKRRVCKSTGTARLEEAEQYLARVMEETRQAQVYGVRPSRTFEQAAAKFVLENQHKRSIGDDVSRLKGLMPWIGSSAARPDSHGHAATLDRASAPGRGDHRHHQPWAANRASHLKSRCRRMDGRTGPHLAAGCAEDQAARRSPTSAHPIRSPGTSRRGSLPSCRTICATWLSLP